MGLIGRQWTYTGSARAWGCVVLLRVEAESRASARQLVHPVPIPVIVGPGGDDGPSSSAAFEPCGAHWHLFAHARGTVLAPGGRRRRRLGFHDGPGRNADDGNVGEFYGCLGVRRRARGVLPLGQREVAPSPSSSESISFALSLPLPPPSTLAHPSSLASPQSGTGALNPLTPPLAVYDHGYLPMCTASTPPLYAQWDHAPPSPQTERRSESVLRTPSRLFYVENRDGER